MVCPNCKRNNFAAREFCVACGKPMPAVGFEEHPSGTSTSVGPSFFVGQRIELQSHSAPQETANALRTLGWAGVAVGALFVVAVLEWQTWRPATPVAQQADVIARVSAPTISDTKSQAATPVPAQTTPASDVAAPRPISLTPVSATSPVRSAPLDRELDSPRDLASARPDGDTAKVKLLRTAVRQGDTDAPVNLANMYLEGKDVSRNCDQALQLLESAAAQNNARARNRLAALYEIGTCVQRDRVQAYRWLNSALAADRNNSWAQQNLDQTWREMTSEERTVAEAYR